MFDWSRFLDVASNLLAEARDEAALRSAISRAYYAAYHAAAAFVRASGLLQQRHTHQGVWNALVHDPDPARTEAGKRGDQLHRRRIMANYRGAAPSDLEAFARDAVAEARSLVDAISRLG